MSGLSECGVPAEVSISPEGRLYLTGGQHRVSEIFSRGHGGVSEEVKSLFLKNHKERRVWCLEQGFTYSQWIFPDPILFEGSALDGKVAPLVSRAFGDDLPTGVHYPLHVLNKYPDRQSATDTHYSPLGNMYVSREIALEVIGEDADLDLSSSIEQGSIKYGHAGDLGVKFNPPIQEDRFSPRPVMSITSTNNGIASGNNGAIQIVESPNSVTDRKLLVFGDSFLRSMLAELARYWRTIVFLRTPYFHYEMVHGVRPTDILCGMAERYFGSPRPDCNRPHFLAYPLVLGRSLSPTADFSGVWNKVVDQSLLASATSQNAS